MPGLLLIIAGIILVNNAGWFAGAHLVGVICLVVGIIPVVIVLLMLLLGALGLTGAAALDHRAKRRTRVRRGF